LKEELGIDHFEGPILAWPASACARDNYRFRIPPASLARNLKAEKRINGPPPQLTLPAVRQAILERSFGHRHNP